MWFFTLTSVIVRRRQHRCVCDQLSCSVAVNSDVRWAWKTQISSYCSVIYVSCKPYWYFYNASHITFIIHLFHLRLLFIHIHISVVCRNTLCQHLFWKLGSKDCEQIQSKTTGPVVSHLWLIWFARFAFSQRLGLFWDPSSHIFISS